MELRVIETAPLGAGPWTTPLPVAPGMPPSSTDVVIVGAGITGLTAALTLAERGVAVLVLERQFGHGATSRSGGIVLGDTVEGPAPGFDGCERTLGQWIEREAIACGFRWSPCLELARSDELAPSPIDWRDHGCVRAAGEVPGAVLDPVQLLNGLLWSCRRAGVEIVSGVTVEAIRSRGGAPTVMSSGGHTSARHVILATDAMAWGSAHDPWPQRTLTVALQTEVLSIDMPAALGLRPYQPFYTRELPLLWGRPLLDGSFMFGRELVRFPNEASADRVHELIESAGQALAARVRGLHPRLAAAGVHRVWAGPTARTPAGIPTLIDDPKTSDVMWAGGYGGHGLAQAFTIGRRAASQVLKRLHDVPMAARTSSHRG
jgi:glycine/D-amino acid oxidase-like deaminating enzyme